MKMNVQKPEYETENENRLKVHKTGDDIVHNCALISEKDCAIL